MSNPDKEIIGKQCAFVTHLDAIPDVRPDIHLIKEIVHYKDGTYGRELKVVKDFKRPFWITKPHYRNHNDKKESESVDRLNMFKATQSNLPREVAIQLGGKYVGAKTMRDVASSPYVYGLDVDSRTFIKNAYLNKYPEANAMLDVAALDIEVNTRTNEIVVISITTRRKIFTCYLNKIIKVKTGDTNQKLKYLFDKYIPKTSITEKIEVEYAGYDNEIDLVKNTIAKAHEWKPDFLAVWNIVYDMTMIIGACKKAAIDPAVLFTDPSLPPEYRHFKVKLGSAAKTTASGVRKTFSPEEQWHVFTTASSFYLIDAMSTHRYKRVGGKTIPGGYGLDNMLKHDLGKDYGKLKINDGVAEILTGIDWHRYMLENRPLEYIIYNQWDVISMIQLDVKNKDLCVSISALSGPSSYDIFNSGPKKIVDQIFFKYLQAGRVLGTKSPTIDDDKVLGLGDWIAILPAHQIADNGLRLMLEDSELSTNIRAFIFDSDQ